jgi:hypothetical protein
VPVTIEWGLVGSARAQLVIRNGCVLSGGNVGTISSKLVQVDFYGIGKSAACRATYRLIFGISLPE